MVLNDKKKLDKREEALNAEAKKHLYNLMLENNLFAQQISFILKEMLFYKKNYENISKQMNELICTENNPNQESSISKIKEKNHLISELESKIQILESKILILESKKTSKNLIDENICKVKELFNKAIQENTKHDFTELIKLNEKVNQLIQTKDKNVREILTLKAQNEFLEKKIEFLEKEKINFQNFVNSEREEFKKQIQIHNDNFMILKYKLEEIIENKINENLSLKKENSFLNRIKSFQEKEFKEFSKILENSVENYKNYEKIKVNCEKITDEALLDELINLSTAFDKINLEYKETFEKMNFYFLKSEKLEEKLISLENDYEKKIENLKSFSKDKDDNFNIFLEKTLKSNENKSLLEEKEIEILILKRKLESAFLNLQCEKESFESFKLKSDNISKAFLEKENEILLEKSKINELEKSISIYKNIFDNFTESGSLDSLDELEKYKTLLKCSSCSINFKDTVLVKCMHVFCNICIEQRLKTRVRKCPSCNEGFSVSDVHKIYL